MWHKIYLQRSKGIEVFGETVFKVGHRSPLRGQSLVR